MQDELTEEQKRRQVLGIHDDAEEIEPWDHSVAQALADAEAIKLSDAHFEVLDYLRDTYQKHGQIRHARSLSQALDTQFADKGGNKYLYTLFPDGPVSQGCKIAGIPAPKDSRNESFGSTM
ncbi:MAG: TusE/DsrC/DsvC family sulfur relay protein [Thioalkalispiraceae bacterium]|jgi:tRNA 2-thiouridine synthesizing protein E